jgi:hypothetical protein
MIATFIPGELQTSWRPFARPAIQPSEVTAHINVWVCRAPTSDTANILADLMPAFHGPPQLHYSEGRAVTRNISVRVLAPPYRSLRFVPGVADQAFRALSRQSTSNGFLSRKATPAAAALVSKSGSAGAVIIIIGVREPRSAGSRLKSSLLTPGM